MGLISACDIHLYIYMYIYVYILIYIYYREKSQNKPIRPLKERIDLYTSMTHTFAERGS